MSGDEIAFQQSMSDGHTAAWDGMWERAAVYYRQALDEIPDHPKALTSLGLALFELGEIENALENYLQAVSASPGDPLPLEKSAQLFDLLNNYGKAIEASLLAAETYANKRDIDKAIENLSRVTRIDPENKVAHSRLALIYDRLGHKQQAVVEYLALASLMQQEGEIEKANQAVDRALQILPTSVEAQKALSFLTEMKPLPKPTRSGVPAVFPRQPRVEQLEASKDPDLLYSETDPVTEAHKNAMASLAGIVFEIYPDDTGQQENSRGLQNIVSGTSDINYQTQADHHQIYRHLNQAIILQTEEHTEDALAEFRQTLIAGLDTPAVYFVLGYLYIKVEEIDNAVSILAKAVNHADFALGTRLLMGKSFVKLGNFNEAAIEYLEALRIADASVVDPRDAVKLKQSYEPIIEAETRATDSQAKEQLCESIENLLMQSNWRDRLNQVRQDLPVLIEGGPPRPIGEIMTESSSSEVVELIASVHKLARDGHIRSAMEEAFFALQFAPTYLPLHIYMGELLLKQELLQLALTKFTVVAQAYGARGESLLAIDLFRRIIRLAPMDLSTRYLLIEELKKSGFSSEAVEEYLKLAGGHYNFADLQRARNTYTDALQYAEKSRVDDAVRIQILHQLADIDVQSFDWRHALKVYEQIRILNPNDRKAMARLVELNFRLGLEAQAISEMDQFLSYFINNGKPDEAIIFLNELIQESPRQKHIQKRLIELYLQEGRKSDAIKFLDSIGEKLMLEGDRAGAIEVVGMILALEPPNIDEYRVLLEKISRKQAP